MRGRPFRELEKRLGHKFRTATLLEEALTHASLRGSGERKSDNERLEFIGDRVLGLAIAELLNETFPAAREGELARLYNKLVRGETCAKVAREVDLGKHLKLAASEVQSGGRQKTTILADGIEAVLGAVFLDAGFDKARGVVRELWAGQTPGLAGGVHDPKSALQEWAQGRGLPLPKYVEIARFGPDHAPVFTSEVRISGVDPARGEGASKRAAEQAAATAFLLREGVAVASADGEQEPSGA
jgi:ribonuclease III